MKVTILPGETTFFEQAALRFAQQLREKPDSLIGFATGRTTGGIHAALARLHQAEPFDATRATVFAMDEITNMPRECPASCFYLIYNDVVKPLGIPDENMIMPDPMSLDPAGEARSFEQRLIARGKVDLLELGLGENGHLGFNQPGTPFGQTTWISWMDDSLHDRLCREYQLDRSTRFGGLTIGPKNIMMSRKILLVVNGAHKAEVVRRALTGDIDPSLPASILQLHPNCEVLLDEAAGSLVREFVFLN